MPRAIHEGKRPTDRPKTEASRQETSHHRSRPWSASPPRPERQAGGAGRPRLAAGCYRPAQAGPGKPKTPRQAPTRSHPKNNRQAWIQQGRGWIYTQTTQIWPADAGTGTSGSGAPLRPGTRTSATGHPNAGAKGRRYQVLPKEGRICEAGYPTPEPAAGVGGEEEGVEERQGGRRGGGAALGYRVLGPGAGRRRTQKGGDGGREGGGEGWATGGGGGCPPESPAGSARGEGVAGPY